MDDVGVNNQIQKIIFDMDGVITSERGYWYSAAMTVYEKIFEELNVKWCEENIDELSLEIFSNDNVILNLKNLGVNTNWDLAYLTYLAAIIGQSEGLEDEELWKFVDNYFEEISLKAPEIYEYVSNEAEEIYNFTHEYAKRNGELWNELCDLFQHWYLGDKGYEKIYERKPLGMPEKSGFINKETPIVDFDELTELLKYLTAKGYKLGIGTGRNDYELSVPLTDWDILKYFDKDSIVTYDTVLNAEKASGGASLAKPHPYVFLKAATHIKDDDVNKEVSSDNSNILVVGDAGADILAAKAAKMRFAAVLTGVGGNDAYEYFSGMDADYILDSVIELKDIL